MKYLKSLLIMLLTCLTAKAQIGYDVSLIPKNLLSHASTVIRENAATITVKSLDDVVYHYKTAVTILNKNGDPDARLYVYYSKYYQINNIKGMIYDETGKPNGKILERNFEDKGVSDGFSLFVDDRVKVYNPAVMTYPYTIEYEYEIKSKQTLFLPDWDPNIDKSMETSVQHSSYKLICKPDFNIRYKELNFPGKVAVTQTTEFKSYTWEIENVKAMRYEPYSPDNNRLFVSVKIAPYKFSYAGVTGSFTNWDEYGKCIYNKLLLNRDQLPPETVDYVTGLVKNIADPKLKAKKIYEFMQQKTRYVSVQIGIGGYQPFLASEVDHTAYGDCKALVNYTQALLKAVGIQSYYVLVMAGSEKINALPDFASMNQFDHVILCLPFKNDTTWLECTSKKIPFGYLGDFTDDRFVVACTPEGGKLMHTPKYTTAANKQLRKADFTLANNGELSGNMETSFEGAQYENREELMNETEQEQIKNIKKIYPVENLDVLSFSLKQNKSLQPVTIESIKLDARDYAARNGERLFFTPNTASRYIKPLREVTNRSNPVYINRGYLDEDEISYVLPADYKVATRPLNIVLDKPFGRYMASTQVVDNKLLYKRTLQINDGNYSKDTYADMVDFYQSVFEADNYTLSLEKK